MHESHIPTQVVIQMDGNLYFFFCKQYCQISIFTKMKTDNPDEIMLNPEYLKKMEDSEKEKQSDEIPQDLKDYVDELMENPLNQVDCSVMKYILDYLSDPMNSSIYRDQAIFKNQSNIDEQNDESEEFRVTIPIFSTKF